MMKKGDNKVWYNITKREAKKSVVVKNKIAYEYSYKRIESKEGEKEVFKLARLGKEELEIEVVLDVLKMKKVRS